MGKQPDMPPAQKSRWFGEPETQKNELGEGGWRAVQMMSPGP